MSWFGKLAGGALGFLMGGPVGAALGAALGHQLDQSTPYFRHLGAGLSASELAQLERAFLGVLFPLMGHLAKADGYISEDEIACVRKIMSRLDLTPDSRLKAMRLFNEGKQNPHHYQVWRQVMETELAGSSQLSRLLLSFLCELALADGPIHPRQETILRDTCEVLRFSKYEYFGLRTRLETEHRFWRIDPNHEGARGEAGPDQRAHQGFRYSGNSKLSGSALHEAYNVLGIALTAQDAEIKRAYRRAISRHHPDKLTARGASAAEIQMATEATQKIQKAYELICVQRSL